MKNRTQKRLSGRIAVIMAACLLLALVPSLSARAEAGGEQGLMVGVGIEAITPTSDMYPMTWGSGNRGCLPRRDRARLCARHRGEQRGPGRRAREHLADRQF